jgi:glutamine synthetase
VNSYHRLVPGFEAPVYELAPEEHAGVPQVPTDLPSVLGALEVDHEYPLQGDVFTPDLIETWIELKRENEIAPLQLRPHPHEFEPYFDM